jgi:serine/threonine-protein kinase RsbW
MRTAKFPAEFQYLDEIRAFVGEIAREGGFSDKEVYSIQLAADEAASNVIEHAYRDIPDGELEIRCGVKGNTLTIVLRDRGRSFDPASVRPPNIQADLAERQLGGLGIYLMRKLMDDVRYEQVDAGRNQLTLIKRRG